jgi:hypothetical protein
MKLLHPHIPRKWARGYFFVLETIVLVTFFTGLLADRALRPYGFEPEGIFGSIMIVLYIASFILLLLTFPLLFKVEQWLGVAAFATVVLMLLFGVLLPAR